MKLEVKDGKKNLPIDDPSRNFILKDLGLPGSCFNYSVLEFQIPIDFFSDNIIDFWIKHSIKISSCSDKFFHVDATLLTCYGNNDAGFTKKFCASMKK